MKNNTFFMFFTKALVSIILTLIILILIKSSSKFKNNFYKQVYATNIQFAKFNELYNKYIVKKVEVEPVVSEKLTYKSKSKYLDGVKLEVNKNYVVKANKSGVVVFIGPKEGYNNTVIIQRIDGVDEWYGNINNVNVSMYDYVNEKTIIGDTNDILYLVYKKGGNTVDYEEYIN